MDRITRLTLKLCQTPSTKDSLVASASTSMSSGTLGSLSRFPIQGGGENVLPFTTAAALTALHHQQQQSRLAASKPSSLGATSSREGQPHRGRGRPPKSSFAVTKVGYGFKCKLGKQRGSVIIFGTISTGKTQIDRDGAICFMSSSILLFD